MNYPVVNKIGKLFLLISLFFLWLSQTASSASMLEELEAEKKREQVKKVTKNALKISNSKTQPVQPKKPPKTYSLKIQTIPANSTVQITNIKPKYYAGMRLKKGTYKIKVFLQNYATKKISVMLSKNKVVSVKLLRKQKIIRSEPRENPSPSSRISGSQFLRSFYSLAKSVSLTESYALMSHNAQQKLPFNNYCL